MPLRTLYLLSLLSAIAHAAAPSPVRTEIFNAGEDWHPIQWQPAHIVKGSALDFAPFLDAPAGKYGPVISRNGRFVFKDAPEKDVRLYGAVISHSLPFLDKAHCEQLADYLAACGYNGVRLHNYNFAKGVMKDIGSTEFTPEAQDQLDYFFYCLKQRGIYFTFPINAWGFFKAGDAADIPEFSHRAFRFESDGLLPISADLQQWFKTYAAHLLGHKNPYTGLALKDDPALVSLELNNESSLLAVLDQHSELIPIYRRLCREYLVTALGHDPTPADVDKELPSFVLRRQEHFIQTMTAFLSEFGVQQPLTDLNFRDNQVYALPRALLDYVDIHAYWSLYRNLPDANAKPGAELAYRQTWLNPNTVSWGTFLGTVPGRLFGRPYMNSEFNSCYATPYWSFSGPTEAVLAATQGWSGVFRCGLAADEHRFFKAIPVRQIGTAASPLMMLSERIGAMLFAQGEVKPLRQKIPFVVTPEYLLSKTDIKAGPKYPSFYSQLAFDYQIGTVLLDGKEKLDGYPCFVAPEDMKLSAYLANKQVLHADANLLSRVRELVPTTPALDLDTAKGSAQIITPRTETFMLPADMTQATGHTVSLTGNTSVALCFAGSLDSQPLANSNRILALYLTDLKNTGTEVEYTDQPKGTVIIRNAGKLPLLVRQGSVEITFKIKDRPLPRIWALKFDGSRSQALEPHTSPGGFSFKVAAVTDAETFAAYELVWDTSQHDTQSGVK